MRKKNQAVKELIDLSPIGQLNLLRHGAQWLTNRPAVEFVDEWRSMLLFSRASDGWLTHAGFNSRKKRDNVRHMVDGAERELTAQLAKMLVAAIDANDGAAFRKLAYAVEAVSKGYDRMRYWLVNYFALAGGVDFFATQPPRQSDLKFHEVKSAFEKAIGPADDRQLRRAIKEIGVKLRTDKSGPKGPRGGELRTIQVS